LQRALRALKVTKQSSYSILLDLKLCLSGTARQLF
jgi:hypothetical protein